jgi:hypothetical protein
MNGLVWLASYPKSGNTWCSIFLTHLLSGVPGPVDLTRPLRSANFAAREHFDRLTGWESAELRAGSSTRLRPLAQEALAREGVDAPIKTHDAFADPRDGQERFSRAATRGVLFLVRNPLDIVGSLSHHSGLGLDETIAYLNSPRAAQARPGNSAQLPELLLDWSSHARSWVDAHGLPVLTTRYEDLLRDPEGGFRRMCEFAGLPTDPARIARAVGQSRFDILREQEARTGFAEAPPGRRFFRSGRSGTWRATLSDRQVEAVVACHEPMMRRFGYWSDAGATE